MKKSYAIAEVKNALDKVDSIAFDKSFDPVNLQVARNIFNDLETIFKLYLGETVDTQRQLDVSTEEVEELKATIRNKEHIIQNLKKRSIELNMPSDISITHKIELTEDDRYKKTAKKCCEIKKAWLNELQNIR